MEPRSATSNEFRTLLIPPTWRNDIVLDMMQLWCKIIARNYAIYSSILQLWCNFNDNCTELCNIINCTELPNSVLDVKWDTLSNFRQIMAVSLLCNFLYEYNSHFMSTCGTLEEKRRTKRQPKLKGPSLRFCKISHGHYYTSHDEIETWNLFCRKNSTWSPYKTNFKSLSHQEVELWPWEISQNLKWASF